MAQGSKLECVGCSLHAQGVWGEGEVEDQEEEEEEEEEGRVEGPTMKDVTDSRMAVTKKFEMHRAYIAGSSTRRRSWAHTLSLEHIDTKRTVCGTTICG